MGPRLGMGHRRWRPGWRADRRRGTRRLLWRWWLLWRLWLSRLRRGLWLRRIRARVLRAATGVLCAGLLRSAGLLSTAGLSRGLLRPALLFQEPAGMDALRDNVAAR